MAQKATVSGVIIDEKKIPVIDAHIFIGNQLKAKTSVNGAYELELNANQTYKLAITHINFDTVYKTITLTPEENLTQNFKLTARAQELGPIDIYGEPIERDMQIKIDPKVLTALPGGNGTLEKVLIFEGLGVSSTNEMSSQYNVRGGNFDENLVYINDVEVYRPFLVRSGQQEGLSIINPDMVESVTFSSGGFASKYGDKMSSVLDVEYKKPDEDISGAVEASLLGASIYIGDASESLRFTQIHGFRYRTNQYLLNSLDVQGDYAPAFLDYQGYFTYDVSDQLELDFLGSFSRNEYVFIPENRTTDFGSVSEALRLTIFFNGQEVNRFQTGLGSFRAVYLPNEDTRIRFIASAMKSDENETYDVEGAYSLDELNKDLGSEEFGDVAFNRGIGGFIEHARNYLDIFTHAYEVKATHYKEKSIIDWGVKQQFEIIYDELSEWELIDSAGYSIPTAPSDNIYLDYVVKAKNELNTFRTQGYIQYRTEFETKDTSSISLNTGIRAHYYDFNGQLTISPRASVSFQPNWNRDMAFRASWGYYQQPPFYRELRAPNGLLNPEVLAQTSIHYVLGFDYILQMWGRPFKLSTEAYYKQLKNLNPYEIDNVRIRYYADNNANGYAAGWDFKLNGEFVKGVESWVSLSLMKTEEDLEDDFYYEYYDANGDITTKANPFRPVADSAYFEPGYIPRPTDQRVNFALFFQDYLPNNPTFKMNVTIMFSTGLPTGPPSFDRYKDVLRMPAYRRVDLGLMKQLVRYPNDAKRKARFSQGVWKGINNSWLSLEVFNLLQINNTISYTWVRDINDVQYGVPNYLTGRQVNLKLRVEF